MGSKGSSQPQYLPSIQNTSQTTSGSSQSTSSQAPDPLARLAYEQTLANASQIAQTPFEPYQGQMVAGLSPDQLAAFQGVRQMQGVQTPYIGQAGNLYEQSTNTWQNPFLPKAESMFGQSFGYIENPFLPQTQNYLTGALTSAVNPLMGTTKDLYGQSVDLSNIEKYNQQALSRYMNPFQQSVVDATLAQMKQNQDVLVNQNTANAIRQGAFGGSGQFMGMAELGRQQALANAQTLAQLNAQNYAQAQAQYNQQQQQAIQARQQAAQILGQLGQQQAGLLAGTGVNAAQLMGQLGSQQAERGIQAYQGAARGLGELGQQQQSLGVSALQNAAQGVAGLGKQAQQAALTDLQALMAVGEQQRALEQQQLDAAQKQWLQAKAYPYQQTSYFAGLAGGLGPLLGSTAQQQATSTGTQTGTSVGIEPYQQPQQGGGTIPGIITSGLGLLGKAFGLKDGGRVGYAEGGAAESPYSSGELESPVTSRVGLGALMGATPYEAPDDYIGEAAKLQRAIKPASEAGRERLMSQISKALDAIPEFRQYKPKLGSGSMEEYSKYPRYTGRTEGEDWGDVAKSVGELAGSQKFRSGVSESIGDLGSILKSFQAGGRVGYADGGTPAEQYARSQKAQQDAAAIQNLYKTVLGRPAEQEGFDVWARQASAGMPMEEMAGYFRSAPENIRNIRGLYADYLGRPAEQAGLDAWAGQVRSGMSFGELEDRIKNSPEAQARAATPVPTGSKVEQGWAALDPSAGMNKALARERMIAPLDRPMSNYDMLLQQAMRRNPGPQLTPEQQGMPGMPGPDFYSSARPVYPGTSKPAGSLNLSQSMGVPEKATDEQIKNFATALYTNYLGREPAEAEISSITTALQSGTKPADLEAAVLSSPEGQNTQYIKSLYESTLGRPADLGGLQFFKGELAKGIPARDLVSMFEKSPEYTSVPSAFRGMGPVQGYYTRTGSRMVNPYTGLFNMEYTAPYRGRQVMPFLPRKDGGRAERAAGGRLGGNDLYQYLISIGATDKEAAMLTGMAKTESGFNPYVMHDKGTGYGLWGHGKDRWADMQKYTGERKPGWEDQAKFALWELRNSPKVALARQTLNKADDARDVAIAGMHFERPQGYTAAAPWLGKNWQDRYSNVSNLMLGRDIGKGPTLRLGGGEPNEDSIMYKGIATPANSERSRGLIPRLLRAFAPVSSAEAAPGSVLSRINPNDPSGPLLPAGDTAAATAERKPMFAMPKFAVPEMRNPRMATLPEALGRPNWPNEERGTLPEFKPEVREGFGPLRGEKPADAAQLLMEPTQRANMGPEMPVAPTTVAEDRQKKESGQKYFGDWRDVEPFKSDPIGGFFDELMGEKPMADKPGTLESAYFQPRRKGREEDAEFDLGSLFGFAHGGVARNGYAEGGSPEEDFDPLSELGSALESGLGGLGDALGGLFGEGKDARSAEEAAVVASDRVPSRRGYSPISEGLLAAGLGMLAAPTRNPWQAVGIGGLRGLQVYEAASEQERKQEEMAAKQAAAEKAAERYQQQISGAAPVAEDTGEEAPKTPGFAPIEKPEEAAPAPAPTPTVSEAGVLEPETADIEADPTLRRLSQQYARVASIPAPPGMSEAKKAQLSNLKFQIEERRRQLESSVKARKAQVEAQQKTPKAKARSKMLETEQEALAKEAVGVEQAARQADQRIATLGRMKEAVESGRFSTGFGAETKLGLQKAVQSIFPKMVDEEAIAMAEQFEKDALQAVTDATGGKLGAGVSNADVEFLSRQQAGLGTSKAGNILTLDAAIKIEQRKKDIAQFARDYREAHGGVLDQGYYKALSDWSKANPMFPKESGKAAASPGRSQYTPEERAKAAEILRRRREGKQ